MQITIVMFTISLTSIFPGLRAVFLSIGEECQIFWSLWQTCSEIALDLQATSRTSNQAQEAADPSLERQVLQSQVAPPNQNGAQSQQVRSTDVYRAISFTEVLVTHRIELHDSSFWSPFHGSGGFTKVDRYWRTRHVFVFLFVNFCDTGRTGVDDRSHSQQPVHQRPRLA